MEYEAKEKAVRDYNQGMLEAEQRGETRGEAQGRAEEKIAGIQILITVHIEEEIPKEKTITKLQKHYHLTKKEAEQYYERYSKDDEE